jgi:DNA-binding CsgD family transcriptional regulator
VINDRNKQIARLVLQGRTYASVAMDYGISSGRVRQIVRRIMRQIASDRIDDGFSIRELRRHCDELIRKINEK